MEKEIILVLLGFLIFSNVYWAVVVQRLVNKLMSRDYFEYRSSLTHKQAEKTEKIEANDPAEDLGPLHEIMF